MANSGGVTAGADGVMGGADESWMAGTSPHVR